MDAKAATRECLERLRITLVALSHRIHANPELGFEEERAATWLCEALVEGGFAVDRGVYDLSTAFVARAGSGPLHVAICAEYDCLPGIGHACGHNVIGSAAVGAGLALGRIADDVGLTVSVIGTPAEESGGGKILLLERGAFAGVHAAMMVHPAPIDIADPKMLAWSQFDIHYQGKEAHASAFPELGINALDALTIAQTSIGLLRQHMRPTDRVHGIITKGGDAANVVPAHTSARYMVRAETMAGLEEIEGRVMRCFEAGALATGRPAVRGDHARFRDGFSLSEERRRARTVLPAARVPRPGGLDRHGQHLAGHAVDSSDDRSRLLPDREPPAGVRRLLRDARCGSGSHRRRRGHGMDGHRPGE
jgi:amidohydrolase